MVFRVEILVLSLMSLSGIYGQSKRQNLQRDLSGMRSSSSIPHPPTFYQQNCGCNPFRLLHNVTIPSKFSPQVEHPPINASFVHIPQQPIPIAGATSDGSKVRYIYANTGADFEKDVSFH